MHERGFTYIGLLLLVAITSVGLAAAGSLWSIDNRREKEAELLFVGAQFTAAIAAYRDRTPAGQPQRFPPRVEDLLDDKRWPTTRRHLRRVFVDPMTGTQEWGIVEAPGGGVMGVYSLAQGTPLKRDGFPVEFTDFAAASSYGEWRFVYTLRSVADEETN